MPSPGDDDEIIIRRHQQSPSEDVGEVDTTNATFAALLALLPANISSQPVNALRNSLVALTA